MKNHFLQFLTEKWQKNDKKTDNEKNKVSWTRKKNENC